MPHRHHHHHAPSHGASGPPVGTYDPELESQRQAGERGLVDLLFDIHRQKRQSRRGFHQQRRESRLQEHRGARDIRRQTKQTIQGIQYQRQDARTTAQRSQEDFAFQLNDLIRSFGRLGETQRQNAVAQGVGGEGGTLAASAEARAGNLAYARQPIETGQQRTSEDLATALERLRTQAGQVHHEQGIQLGRLHRDTHRDIHLGRLGLHQDLRGLNIQKQRGIREQKFNDLDLLKEEWYQAGKLTPGRLANLGG